MAILSQVARWAMKMYLIIATPLYKTWGGMDSRKIQAHPTPQNTFLWTISQVFVSLLRAPIMLYLDNL